jgi:hypothetical protein
MALNKQTNGFLVFDMSDKITSHDEAYATTTSGKDVGPCARSVFIIKKVIEDGKVPLDNIIR